MLLSATSPNPSLDGGGGCLTLSALLYGHPHTNVDTQTPIHKYLKNRIDPMHVARNWNAEISFPCCEFLV